MRFPRGLVLALGSALALSALAPRASAQSRAEFLAEQLRQGGDFRVRTQAALALGASDDAAAVAPLCAALNDENEVVRSAAAAALGKLGKADGASCLAERESDASPAVRAVVAKSLRALRASSRAASAAKAAYYVAVGAVTDRTGRGTPELAALIRDALVAKLEDVGGFAFAPADETPAAARALVASRKWKAYYLQTSLEPPRLEGDALQAQVRMTMWTYPAKALQGEFSPTAALPGARLGDANVENSLFRSAAERAAESFAKTVSSASGAH